MKKNDIKTNGVPRLFEHVLLATDGSLVSLKAEKYAVFIANTGQAKLSVVHVVDDSLCHYGRYDTLVPSGTGEDFSHYVIKEQKSQADKLLSRFYQMAKNTGQEFDLHIRQGDPAKEICAMSDEVGADLVIIGRKKSAGILGIKSTDMTDRVQSRVNCSLMVIV